MLAITIAVAAFLIVGSLLVGSMLGWVLREYMMYHHDKQPTQPTMHPEMFDENGNYNSGWKIGNPNTGKTSLFNKLTGLNQKVGNYPGITVEKKEGKCVLDRMSNAHLIDLPGTYSINASSIDESIVLELLMNKNNRDYPDVAIIVTDVENLKRNLLLFTQIKDLNIPSILAINMSDRMDKKGIKIDVDLLE